MRDGVIFVKENVVTEGSWALEKRHAEELM